MSTFTLDVAGRRVDVSNPDKVLYPRSGFTKRDVVEYYVRIAPVLLPHLEDRPLTLKRYPDGVEGEFFYQKDCPSHRPDWVRTRDVYSESSERTIGFCLANDLATLVWLANLANLELHTSLHRATDLDRPTAVAFDLDPGAPADVLDCAEVALWLRDELDGLRLAAYPKTSGSKGVQVYVPLHTPATYEDTKPFARKLAERLERDQPDRVTSNMRKSLRHGRVLVDWSQNTQHKTTVNAYSLRAKRDPTVSTPLTWDEVQAAVDAQDPERLKFTADDVLTRVDAKGDLFAPVLTQEQTLPQG